MVFPRSHPRGGPHVGFDYVIEGGDGALGRQSWAAGVVETERSGFFSPLFPPFPSPFSPSADVTHPRYPPSTRTQERRSGGWEGMSDAKDPAIKLFGRTIPLPESLPPPPEEEAEQTAIPDAAPATELDDGDPVSTLLLEPLPSSFA
ncbi:hypothetical protein B296_00034861 [Ensete ventricosum]|uniref:Uncharacterized protein n=1 Tax=Ensete ventricosum TaxID=4639 RepID=A0A426Y3X5_ENSVE|nr:hypothetical protein B296_00034861 [Ensete ventricosum]